MGYEPPPDTAKQYVRDLHIQEQKKIGHAHSEVDDLQLDCTNLTLEELNTFSDKVEKRRTVTP